MEDFPKNFKSKQVAVKEMDTFVEDKSVSVCDEPPLVIDNFEPENEIQGDSIHPPDSDSGQLDTPKVVKGELKMVEEKY